MNDWSLVTGWLPAVMTAAGFAALLWLALFRLDRRVVLTIIVAGGVVGVAYAVRPFPDPLPVSVLVWAWLGLCGLALGVLRLVGAPAARGLVALVAGVVALVGIAGVQINRYYGQYPTLGTVFSRPALVDLSTVERAARVVAAPEGGFLSDVWRAPQALPANGTVSRIAIPATVSGFSAREGYVYLPSGYHIKEERPLLPVLVLLAGQPGNADSWLVGGQLTRMIDEYAARHHGLAPVVVMPDNLGANFANPLCVDSKRGNVETYLKTDVPQWIRATLQVATAREQWAIAGLSNGGTCALQMAVRAPAVYGRFIDISGEYEPLDGSKQDTIDNVFGGDASRYAAVNPVDIMARQRFEGTAGRIVVGSGDSYRAQLEKVMAACVAAGMDMSWRELAGGHTWAVWAPGLEQSLDWLALKTRLVR